MKLKKAILIIDPYVSPQYLLKRFSEFDFSLIALKTLSVSNDYLSYENLSFAEILKSTGIVAKDILLIQTLKQYDIIHGIVGAAPSVSYAERLLAKLFPKAANNITTSHYRFDKFSMNEVLKQHNFEAVSQQKISMSTTEDEKIKYTLDFYNEHGGKIVIKPNSGSSGSVGVYSPTETEDIKKYYKCFNDPVYFKSDFLLQEKLYGKEYYIDAVSYQDTIKIVSIGLYRKEEVAGRFLYQYADSIDINSKNYFLLQKYGLACLKTLGVKNGFSHLEIIERNGKFKLIELNMRVSGAHGWCNKIAFRKYGWDQVSVYLSLLNNTIVKHENQSIYQRLFFFKNYKGEYSRINMEFISNLSSYVSHEIFCPSMKEKAGKDESVLTFVMVILLENTSSNALQEDTNMLLSVEKKGSCLK